jgi:tetratricopeptide (TPR) repeat protein
LLHLALDQQDNAKEILLDLKSAIEERYYEKLMRVYYFLQGEIEYHKGNYTEAKNSFLKALSLHPKENHYNFLGDDLGMCVNSLARCFYQSGQYDLARQEYEKITAMTFGMFQNGDIFAKSFYMLAKICEKQGDKAKATEYYEKFLALWQEADPGISEVEEARKKLARE